MFRKHCYSHLLSVLVFLFVYSISTLFVFFEPFNSAVKTRKKSLDYGYPAGFLSSRAFDLWRECVRQGQMIDARPILDLSIIIIASLIIDRNFP